jgi:hypothetical protein
MANRLMDPPAADPLMGAEFQPLRALWEGDSPPYPSEQSARWAIRQLEKRLAAAGALGLHRGMLYVHRQKLIEVAREHAIAQATRRYAGKD